MEEWKKYNIADAPLIPLTDLVEFIVDNRGKTVPTAATGIKLIATNCIKNEFLYPLYEKVRYVSENTYNTWFRSHPKPGDIIFVNKGTPGKTALVPDPVDFCIAQDMMAFRLRSDLVYNKYLLVILRSREIQSFIMNHQVGTIIPHFKKEQLKTLMIPLPEMQIQKSIGDLYFNISEKAVINRRINDNLEQQAQALFKSWFVDFEPFKDQPFVESELGMIPQGWKVGSFSEIMNITSGKRPPQKATHISMESHIPLIGASDIMGYTNNSLYNDKILVIGRVGTHGIIQRFNTPCWPSDNTLVIMSKYYEYCYQILQLIDYSSLNRGSTQPLITQTDIKNQIIIIPEVEILKVFEQIIGQLMQLRDNNISETNSLVELRDSLLPRLMSGELSVNDIKEQKIWK